MFSAVLSSLTVSNLNQVLLKFGTSYSEFVEFIHELKKAVKKINEQ